MFIQNNTQTDHGSILHCALCGGRFAALVESRSRGSAMKSLWCSSHKWQELDGVR